MILIKEIEIVGNGKTINYYKDKGYDIKCNKKITIKIEDLIETSAIKLDCYCDICNSYNNIKYYNYIGNIKRNDLYKCNECAKESRSLKIKELHNDKEKSLSIVNKSKSTNLLKYGVSNYSKTNEYLENSRITNLERYGHETSLLNDKVKEKIKITLIEKYGVDSPLKSEEIKTKFKKTCNTKYGFDNPFQNQEIKDKIKTTLIEKYGVDNVMKNIEIFDKAHKSSYRIIKHNNLDITYQGTYELDFINFCIENNILFEKGPTIDYTLDNKERKYHSDFYIPKLNLICEVKSSWTYNKDFCENKAKEVFSKKIGYNFIFLIDKNYEDLKKILSL
jgi:hypothetical protein